MTFFLWLALAAVLITPAGQEVVAGTREPEVCRVKFLSPSRSRITIPGSFGTDGCDTFKLPLSKQAQQQLQQTAAVFVVKDTTRRRVPVSLQVSGPSNVQEARSIEVRTTVGDVRNAEYELQFESDELLIALKYLVEIEEFAQPLVTPLITITNGSRLKLKPDAVISGFGVPIGFREGKNNISSMAIGGRTTTVISGTARPAVVSYAATLNSAALKTKGRAVVARLEVTVRKWPDPFKRSDTKGPIEFLQRFQSYGDVDVSVPAADYENTVGGKKAVDFGELKDTSHKSSLLRISAMFTTDKDQIALTEGIVTYRNRRLTEIKSHIDEITELKYTPVAGLKVDGYKVQKGLVSVPIKPTDNSLVIEIAPPSAVALHQPSVASIVDQLKKQQAFLEDLLTAPPERYAKSDGSVVTGLCKAKDVTIDTRVFLEELAKQRSLAAGARSKVISNQPIEAVVDDVDAAQLGRQLDFWDGQLQALQELETAVVREYNRCIRAGKKIDLQSARTKLKRTEKTISIRTSP